MAEKLGAVLDFGSQKLTAIVGKRVVNNNFVVLASSETPYAGFLDGEFVEPNELKSSITSTLKSIDEIMERKVTRLFVGVPAEFCMVTSRGIEKNYYRHTKITQEKVDELFLSMDKNLNNNTHSIINVSPLCYELDGSNRTNNPVGAYAKTIKAYACVVLAENKFLDLINGILHDLGVEDIEYVCSALAVATSLISPEERSDGAIILDVGYLTSSISYAVGEGLFELVSFPLGGGQITADICEGMEQPFSVAEQIKQELLITVKPTGLDYYEVIKNNHIERVSMEKANNCAMSTIDEIINTAKEKLDQICEPNDYKTVYLTGGGLAYLKGIEFYMGKILGRKVEVLQPKQVKFAMPDLASVVSLLDTALKMEDN